MSKIFFDTNILLDILLPINIKGVGDLLLTKTVKF